MAETHRSPPEAVEREPSHPVAKRRKQAALRQEPCWRCGSPTEEVHCKIVCLQCGFRRDCSDP